MNASMKITTKPLTKDTKPHLIYAYKSMKQKHSILNNPFYVENPCSSFFCTIVDVVPLAYDVPTKGEQGMMGSGRYLKSDLTRV